MRGSQPAARIQPRSCPAEVIPRPLPRFRSASYRRCRAAQFPVSSLRFSIKNSAKELISSFALNDIPRHNIKNRTYPLTFSKAGDMILTTVINSKQNICPCPCTLRGRWRSIAPAPKGQPVSVALLRLAVLRFLMQARYL